MNIRYRTNHLLYQARWIFDRYAVPSYSQEGEDRILARMFEGRATGTYVDVGAHHPRRFSNTLLLYRCGWSGMNVDALPGTVARFRSRPRDITVECGVGLVEEEAIFVEFAEGALSTFDPGIARLRQQEGYHVVAQHRVQVVPLEKLIQKYLPGRHIDLLTVDVEGKDLDVLKSANLRMHRPEALCLESYVTDLRAHTAIDEFVGELGYSLVAGTGFSRIYRLDDRSVASAAS